MNYQSKTTIPRAAITNFTTIKNALCPKLEASARLVVVSPPSFDSKISTKKFPSKGVFIITLAHTAVIQEKKIQFKGVGTGSVVEKLPQER